MKQSIQVRRFDLLIAHESIKAEVDGDDHKKVYFLSFSFFFFFSVQPNLKRGKTKEKRCPTIPDLLSGRENQESKGLLCDR